MKYFVRPLRSLLMPVFFVLPSSLVLAQEVCPEPTNFQVTSVTAHQAVLTWDGPAEPVYEVRVYGNGVYEEDQYYAWPETNSITLEGLLSNAQYEVRLFRYCPDYNESDMVFVFFNTPPDCPPASNFEFTATETSIRATWDAPEGSTALVWLYKDGVEVDFFDGGNDVLFEGLTPGTTYDFNHTLICADGSEVYAHYVVSTLSDEPEDCPAPANLQFTDVSSSQVTISWDGPADNVYTITLTSLRTLKVEQLSVSGNRVTVSDLDSFSDYEVEMFATCGADNSAPVTGHFSTPATYCTSMGVDSQKNYISHVAFAGIDNVSGNDGGYADNTMLRASVEKGGVYTLTIQPGGLPNRKYISAWIDYNQNGNFDDWEQIAFFNNKNTKPREEITVTIPAEAMTGTTRLRVIVSQHNRTSPCGAVSQGETEDYTVDIMGGVRTAVAVYPNPVQDVLNISSDDSILVTILNADGSVVYEGRSTSNLSVASWKNGIYYVVVNGDKAKAIRFVKK